MSIWAASAALFVADPRTGGLQYYRFGFVFGADPSSYGDWPDEKIASSQTFDLCREGTRQASAWKNPFGKA
jgi:hypothetical protein